MGRNAPLLSMVFALGVAAEAGAALPNAALDGPLRSGLLTDLLGNGTPTVRSEGGDIRPGIPGAARSVQFVPFSNSQGFRNCIVNQFRSC